MSEQALAAPAQAGWRDLILAFIAERRDAKAKSKTKSQGEDEGGQAERADRFEPSVWLADAAQRVGQLHAVTHVLKATHPDEEGAPGAVRQYVRYGASPRGMQAMILAGKILALLDGRYNVAYDDLRQAARPALRHRLILNFDAQAEGVAADTVIDAILAEVQPE